MFDMYLSFNEYNKRLINDVMSYNPVIIKTEDIDKNLKVSHVLERSVKEQFDFYDIEEAPFKKGSFNKSF